MEMDEWGDCICCPPWSVPLQADWAAALACWEAVGARAGGAEVQRAWQQQLWQASGFCGKEYLLFADTRAYIRDITSLVCAYVRRWVSPLALRQ